MCICSGENKNRIKMQHKISLNIKHRLWRNRLNKKELSRVGYIYCLSVPDSDYWLCLHLQFIQGRERGENLKVLMLLCPMLKWILAGRHRKTGMRTNCPTGANTGAASWAQASDNIKTLWFLHFTCQEIDSQILKITASFSDVSSLWYFLTYSLIFPLFHAFWRAKCIESLNISRSGSALRWMSLLTCIKNLINGSVNMQKLQQILSLCRTINTISLAKIHFQSSFISSLLTQNMRGTDYQTNGVPFR